TVTGATARACLHPDAYGVALCRYVRTDANITTSAGSPRTPGRGAGAAPASGGHPIAPDRDPGAHARVSAARGGGRALGPPRLASSPAQAGRLGVRAGRPSRPVQGGGPVDRVAGAAPARS